MRFRCRRYESQFRSENVFESSWCTFLQAFLRSSLADGSVARMGSLSVASSRRGGAQTSPRRQNSRGNLRRSFSKPPSLSTVWEWDGREVIDAVPSTDDVMDDLSAEDPMCGKLWVRSGHPLLRLFARRSWSERFAVLRPATDASPPCLQLFLSSAMEELHEELFLLSPLHLQCLPAEAAFGRAAGDVEGA